MVSSIFFFFFNASATTEIYTLSLHDALPILITVCINVYLYVIVPKGFFPEQDNGRLMGAVQADQGTSFQSMHEKLAQDRKSTRLNSSHVEISYAVFCLKKKKTP